MDSIVKIKCPVCHKSTSWEGNPFRPFCSERCKLIDLGKWIDEGYRIPGEPEIATADTEKEDGN
ncbi:MAG: DNA gyrase inhibitor YacG [Deltaproteobacteria bacterium]|nr:DNA gyrase inhibitor YacG [Deltaproteobacteria bacterium]